MSPEQHPVCACLQPSFTFLDISTCMSIIRMIIVPYMPTNSTSNLLTGESQTIREMASHLQCLLYRCHSYFSPSSPQHIDDHDLHEAQDFTIHSLTASAGVCAMHDSVLRSLHVRGAVPPRSPRNHLLLAQALSWLLKPIPDSFLHI